METIVLLCVCVLSGFTGALAQSQILGAYFSSLGADTVGQGGLNTLNLCFFDPAALSVAASQCDFTNPQTPCVAPAAGGGTNNLQWIYNSISITQSSLSQNTAPVRGGKPTYLISFGGANEGGRAWDTLFSAQASATAFGTNAAQLAVALQQHFNGSVVVGIDLDIEGTVTTLPYFGAFILAFRAIAPYGAHPLQICAVSSLANVSSPDHYKVDLLRAHGPAQGGLSHLNMMVDNVDQSCAQMGAFWLDAGLAFLPPSSKVFGAWGELFPSWILHDPGCDTLFGYMRANGVGLGIWEWWTGPVDSIAAVVAKVRQQ